MAMESQGVWDKVKGKKVQGQSWEVGRQRDERRAPTWSRKVMQEEFKPEEWDEVPNRRVWMLGYGFYTPISDQLSQTYRHESHRIVDSPTRWGLHPDYDELRCSRFVRHGHKARW